MEEEEERERPWDVDGWEWDRFDLLIGRLNMEMESIEGYEVKP